MCSLGISPQGSESTILDGSARQLFSLFFDSTGLPAVATPSCLRVADKCWSHLLQHEPVFWSVFFGACISYRKIEGRGVCCFSLLARLSFFNCTYGVYTCGLGVSIQATSGGFEKGKTCLCSSHILGIFWILLSRISPPHAQLVASILSLQSFSQHQ